VLAREVVNALQKVSPEAGRAGQFHSSPSSPTKAEIWIDATKACGLHWSKDFRLSGSISQPRTSIMGPFLLRITMVKVPVEFHASVAISALVVGNRPRIIQGSEK
jgi:hypothetical protein